MKSFSSSILLFLIFGSACDDAENRTDPDVGLNDAKNVEERDVSERPDRSEASDSSQDTPPDEGSVLGRDIGRDMGRGSGIQGLSMGRELGCYIEKTKLYCWGTNNSGEIGDGTRSERLRAVFVLDGVKKATAGFGHACALKVEGSVWCWGTNESGELGDGSGNNSLSPVQVSDGQKPLDKIIDLSTSDFHSCAATESGEVFCWGPGEEGQVGLPNFAGTSFARKIAGLKEVTQVGAKFEYSCALSDGRIYCWGGGDWSGSCGPNFNKETPHIPVEVPLPVKAKSFFLSEETGCAIGVDGNLYCWGGNSYSELGVMPGSDDNPAVIVKGVTNLVSGDGGVAHICVNNKAGEVFCWGNNTFSDEGGPSTINGKVGNDRVKVQKTPSLVKGLPGSALEVRTGDQASCALLKNGNAFCWGNNEDGQLGSGKKGGSSAKPLKVKRALE